MSLTDKQKSKLEKLYTLAQKGYEGEKQNAQKFLERLLHKHGLTLEDYLASMGNEEVSRAEFKHYSPQERKILVQTIFMLWPEWDGTNYKSRNSNKTRITVVIRCTTSMAMDIEMHYSQYRKDWKKYIKDQADELCSAFCSSNSLYGEDKRTDKERLQDAFSLTAEDLLRMERIANLAGGIEPSNVRKRLK